MMSSSGGSSTTQKPGKSLFKKGKKRKIQNKRHVSHNHDDYNDNDDKTKLTLNDAKINESNSNSDSAFQAIHSIQYKRRVKSLHRKTRIKKERKIFQVNDDKEIQEEANQDLKDRLEESFASKRGGDASAGGGGIGDNDEEEGGILRQKQKMAMEAFIQSQMTHVQGDTSRGMSGGASASSISSPEEEATIESNMSKPHTVQDLYSQIIEESKIAGASIHSTENGAGGGDAAVQEGDVGAGGAMLGGTGIAEVALPVEDRIRVAKETERAAAQREAFRRGLIDGEPGEESKHSEQNPLPQQDELVINQLPMSFGVGPGKLKQTSIMTQDLPTMPSSSKLPSPTPQVIPTSSASSAGYKVRRGDVLNIGTSYAHNYRLHNSEWISNKKRQQEAEATSRNEQAKEVDGDLVSQERIGFAAKRGRIDNDRGGQGDVKRGGGGQANDDRIYRQFVSKERSRR